VGEPPQLDPEIIQLYMPILNNVVDGRIKAAMDAVIPEITKSVIEALAQSGVLSPGNTEPQRGSGMVPAQVAPGQANPDAQAALLAQILQLARGGEGNLIPMDVQKAVLGNLMERALTGGSSGDNDFARYRAGQQDMMRMLSLILRRRGPGDKFFDQFGDDEPPTTPPT